MSKSKPEKLSKAPVSAKVDKASVSGRTTAPPIQIGISDESRAAISAGLNRVLADTFTLYLNTHNFHWNVTGPLFNSLHAMFMVQYTEMWNATDVIAERVRALGYRAVGSYADYSRLSSVKDAPTEPIRALDMVRVLVIGHQTIVQTLREVLRMADDAGDDPSVDMLTQRLTIHEQYAWMLRTLLEE